MKACIFAALLIVGIVLCFFGMAGCAAAHPAAPVPILTHPGQTPTALLGVAKGLDTLIVLSVVAVGIGVASFFFAPAAHAISFPLTVTAAGIEASALVTRTSLWFVPWFILGLIVTAFGFFLYELHKYRHNVEAVIAPVTGEIETVAGTAGKFIGSTGVKVEAEAKTALGTVEQFAAKEDAALRAKL